MAKIFISYAAHDRSTARRVISHLEALGIEVWSADDLRSSRRDPGGERSRPIEAVVVLVSPASARSDPITEEWSTALLSSRRVIPVLIDGANFWHLPTRLQDIEAVDLNVSYSAGIDRLVELLREAVSSSDPKPGDLVTIEPRPKTIFIAISFADEMEPTFAAIRSAAERVGMEAERIKDLDADYRVTETIMHKIDSARLVVADLTLERQNVYFELGYARGKGKTVVTLLKSGSRIHVDVRGWNYIEYIDSRPLEEVLVRRFTAEIEADDTTEHGD